MWHTGSSAQALVVVECRLSCPTAFRTLVSGPGINPVYPALEGRFLTTGPLGKSWESFAEIGGTCKKWHLSFHPHMGDR